MKMMAATAAATAGHCEGFGQVEPRDDSEFLRIFQNVFECF